MAELFFAHRALEGESGHEAGRQLLAQLYDRHVGGDMPSVLLTSMGKPYFEGSPWHFSISHTPQHVFCVLADCPVGLDAEELSRQVRPDLAKKVLSETELRQYEAAQDQNRALLTFWVLKEASGKCSGKGVGFHPRHTEFSLSDGRVFQHSGCLLAIITEE